MKKTLLSLLVLLCAAATASAETITFTVDGVCYQVNTTNAPIATIVKGSYYGVDYSTLSGDLVIPSEVTHNGVTYSVHSVNQNAFANCENITSISLPNSLKIIWSGAFQYCTSLTSLTIPASVTNIYGDGSNSLNSPIFHCDNLTTIVVEEGNQVYDSRDNCNAIVETATNRLIHGCKGTVIPASVILGKNAFRCCSITDVVIPEGVTTIEQFAFNYCQSLKTVSLPSTLTKIDLFGFNGCDALTDIYAYPAGGSVTLGSNVWLNVPQANCNLHVYPADFEYYSTADQWKEFNVIGDLGETPGALYLFGSWDWTTGVAFVKGENGLWTATKEMAIGDEFKLVDQDDVWYGGVDENGVGYFEINAGLINNDGITLVSPGANFKMAVAGTYTLTADLVNKTLALKDAVSGIIGDANEDGAVNVSDITAIINYILQKNPSPFNLENADVNGDGEVNVMDVTAIINMILDVNS